VVKLPPERAVFASLYPVLTTSLSEDMDVIGYQISNIY